MLCDGCLRADGSTWIHCVVSLLDLADINVLLRTLSSI